MILNKMIRTLISIVILIFIIWVVIVPSPIKYIISFIYPSINYDVNSNAKITKKYTIYRNPRSNNTNIIVVFIGVGGVYCKLDSVYGLTNCLNERLGNEFDIITFNYPVRFKYSILDAMESINNSLIGLSKTYKNIHAIGISFGALLAGAFYNKEQSLDISLKMKIKRIGINFKSFIGLCGLYETNFNNSLLTNLFNFYIMRNTPYIRKYTCFEMQIPRLIMSATSDLLINQTYKYIRTENVKSKIYKSKTLPHGFFQFVNSSESQDAIENMIVFIKDNTDN